MKAVLTFLAGCLCIFISVATISPQAFEMEDRALTITHNPIDTILDYSLLFFSWALFIGIARHERDDEGTPLV